MGEKMKSRFFCLILYSCIQFLFFNTSGNTPIANLIILYDDTEGIVPKTLATSLQLQQAFESQAAPILLTGNLALRVGILTNPPVAEPLPPHQQKAYDSLIREAQETLANAPGTESETQQLCSLQKKLRDKYQFVEKILHNFTIHSAEYNFMPLGRTTTIRSMARELDALLQQTQCPSSHEERFIDIELYVQTFFSNIELEDWHLFLVLDKNGRPVPQHLILFVPINYAKKHDAFDGETIDLAKLGFDKSALKKITRHTLAQRARGYDFPAKKTASSIQQIFLPARKTTVSWNIYLVGHGSSPAEGTPITYLLTKPDQSRYESASIAGMSAPDFLRLIDTWTLLPINIVVYNTCYGGGRHAEAARQLLAIAANISRHANFNMPTIVSVAADEKSTASYREANFGEFFNKLAEIYSAPPKTIEQQKKLLRQACNAITQDSPIVLFQSKTNVAKEFEPVRELSPTEQFA